MRIPQVQHIYVQRHHHRHRHRHRHQHQHHHHFTVRLHVMQRTVLLRPFCPSVCLSVKRVDCDKMKESFAQIFIPYERTFSLVFRHEEWLVGDPLYLKF